VTEASRRWQALAEPTPVWGEIRDFVEQPGERAAWSSEIRMRDGARLLCRVTPIAGHATLVRFESLAAAPESRPVPLRASAG
jgi:hypothetical protein